MEGVAKIKEKKKRENKRFEMVITSNVVCVCVRERGVWMWW